MMKQISYEQLQQWQQQGKAFELIDVREDWERSRFHIGGQHIPMDEVMQAATRWNNQMPVVLYCRKGVRSALLIQRLEDRFGFTQLYNLEGGIYHLAPQLA